MPLKHWERLSGGQVRQPRIVSCVMLLVAKRSEGYKATQKISLQHIKMCSFRQYIRNSQTDNWGHVSLSLVLKGVNNINGEWIICKLYFSGLWAISSIARNVKKKRKKNSYSYKQSLSSLLKQTLMGAHWTISFIYTISCAVQTRETLCGCIMLLLQHL